IKGFIKRNTPTRPNPKPELFSLQEKERQRLENLRKKQEAEEQRRKKVEEEKRRRQAEMKQMREERLRKVLQARERVEQMEEEKKKRMGQKILQNDEKVREEKAAEERSKKKVSKKHGDVDARKQKALRGAFTVLFLFFLQEENEQQEPLQKRREDEVRDKGKKVLELKNLLEQKQVEKAKQRYELVPALEDPKQRGKEKPPQAQLEPVVLAEKTTKVGLECSGNSLSVAHRLAGRREKVQTTSSSQCCPWPVAEQSHEGFEHFGALVSIPPGCGVNPAPRTCCLPGSSLLSPQLQKSLSMSCLGPPKGAEGSGSPVADENNYGLDLNSDDSTDDESDPRKPVPAWADGAQLHQAILHQYYHPVDVDALFGAIPSPQLEHIFYKSKPRYFKRTSSAVWHSPP
ncbi:INCE protein, partial [Scytalopus superciliaris]|nr:INCE protein [Scytalopus superciliaris]